MQRKGIKKLKFMELCLFQNLLVLLINGVTITGLARTKKYNSDY